MMTTEIHAKAVRKRRRRMKVRGRIVAEINTS